MSTLQAALTELQSLERAALIDRWQSVFGTPPPTRAKEVLLTRAIAWQLQLRASPWRQPSEFKKLVRAVRSQGAGGPPSLTPGTRLLREWKGVTHQVSVLSQGFEYEGKPYRSLSAIARTITGTAWSGPAFFGVRA